MPRIVAETARGMRIGEARIWGRPVRYAEYGPADARDVLVMFNGIGANVESAEAFLTRFGAMRVITFDAPGVGGTPAPRVPYRMGHVAALADQLLAQLGVGRVHVFGISWGGAAAQQFVRDFPARCRSLTLAATSAGWVMLPGAPKVLLKMLTPKRHSDPSFLRMNAQALYGGTIALHDELLREFSEALDHGSMRGYVYQLAAISGWTSWHYLPSLKLPALVMMGRDDRIVPLVNGRILAGRLPDARLETVDCGHLFIVTQPAETAARIERFVQDAGRI